MNYWINANAGTVSISSDFKIPQTIIDTLTKVNGIDSVEIAFETVYCIVNSQHKPIEVKDYIEGVLDQYIIDFQNNN